MEANVSFEEVQVKKPSLFGIILSPTVQFERMKQKAPIALPLIIMLLLTAISGALASYVSLKNPMIKNSEAMTMLADLGISPVVTVGIAAGGALFVGAFVFFISAAFYKVCLVILGNDTPFSKLLSVVIFTSIISTLGIFVNGAIALAIGEYELTFTSLAPLFSNKILFAIAANIDIFNIWYYVVMAIGLQTVAGLSKNKAIILVIIVLLIGIGASSLSGLV